MCERERKIKTERDVVVGVGVFPFFFFFFSSKHLFFPRLPRYMLFSQHKYRKDEQQPVARPVSRLRGI